MLDFKQRNNKTKYLLFAKEKFKNNNIQRVYILRDAKVWRLEGRKFMKR